MAKFLFEITQLPQSVLTAALLFGGRTGRNGGWIFGAWFDGQTNAADVEVFLEAIQLEEVGEFEGADVAPGVADFLLEITHDLNEIGEGEAGAVELKPKPLPVKTQREVLTGQVAIGVMERLQHSP